MPRRRRLLHELAVLHCVPSARAHARSSATQAALTVTLNDPGVLLKKKRGHHSHAVSAPAPVVGPARTLWRQHALQRATAMPRGAPYVPMGQGSASPMPV